MKILVIGGGVAGSATALAAVKAGMEPELFEAYPVSSGLEHGVYLTVAVNGVDALAAIDVDQVVRRRGFPTNHITFSSGSGKYLGRLPLGPELGDGTVTLTIRRSDLYGSLYEELARVGVSVSHDKRLVDIEQDGTGVTAVFADGSRAEGDVLVGADGVHSATRRIIDPDNPGPRSTGLGNTGGFTRSASVDAEPGDYHMIWGRRCFFGYTVAPDGEIWWFANPPLTGALNSEAPLSTAQIKRHLVGLFDRDDSPAAAIVQSDQGKVLLTTQYDLPRVPTWRRTRAVIIGDAAHAVSPSSGQGASLAVEDAVTLIRCLRDLTGVEAALAHYETLRRDRVERIVKWGSSMNNTKRSGPLAWFLREFVVPLIFRRAADPAKLEEMSWMYRHHIDWDRPTRIGSHHP